MTWRTAALALLATASTVAAGGASLKGTVTRSGDGGPTPVANAVVLIDGPTLAASPGTRVTVDQRDQTFVPRVVAIATGTTVDFPNHDPMLHNVYSSSPVKKFDLGMYAEGETRSMTFDTPGVVRIGCNVHPKMEAFVVVHPNPWVAVTDARGAYTIGGVPAGSYRVRVWHETLAEREMPITLRDGAVQPLDVRLEPRH